MKLLKSGLAIAVVGFAVLLNQQAYAQEALNYTFIELGGSQLETDQLRNNISGDEINFAGVMELTDILFVGAYYQHGDYDFNPDQELRDQRGLGFGGRASVLKRTDVYGSVSYIEKGLDQNPSDGKPLNQTGYGLSIGIRHLLTENFELGGGVATVEGFTPDNSPQYEYTLGGRMNFSETMSLGGAISRAKDDDSLSVSVKFRF